MVIRMKNRISESCSNFDSLCSFCTNFIRKGMTPHLPACTKCQNSCLNGIWTHVIDFKFWQKKKKKNAKTHQFKKITLFKIMKKKRWPIEIEKMTE